MTAAARTLPDDPEPTLAPPWLDAAHRKDPLVTGVAVGLAVLLHLAVLLLVAFPERVPPLPPERPTTGPVVTIIHPPPPPVEPPPPRPAAAPDRRIALPESDPPELEPLQEEPAIDLAFDAAPGEAVELGLEPTAPPPPPAREPGRPGRDGVSHPVLVDRIEPIYPELPRRARLGGEVMLEAVIGRDGSVGELRVLRANPAGVGFEQAAVAAVSRWRYEPALQRGRAVEVYLTVHVRFTIR